MKSPYDPVEEADRDRPDKRAEWMSRGREAPKGQSAAALRLRAHQQKMAFRAQREAAARKAGLTATAPAAAGWVALGPAPLVTWSEQSYGTVTGRVTSVAIDPSDTTGNTVYIGGAFGGVWKSTNAANGVAANVVWTPVTDQQASLATGALSVKPDGSVVLVGTGEPNNALDSYYGVGVLRSTNGGTSWTLVPAADSGTHPFAGIGFNKFAWSTTSPNTVVATTATAFRGTSEGKITGNTRRGIYRSTDAGLTWAYQAPTDGSAEISATDVVYNASAGKFFAAIRYHGVYSSTDGTSWTRLTTQPSAALTLTNCPTVVGNPTSCPMYRGQFAVTPGRNEMYFWFVDPNDNDRGIWRSTNGGTSWTQITETGVANCGDSFGCGTTQGFYNLEIAAIPNGGTSTDLYIGAINLFKCNLANGGTSTSCSTLDASQPNQWINLTHVYGCLNIANVHPDEHGLDYLLLASGSKVAMYFGNDGGVYRALDGFTDLLAGSCGKTNGFDDLSSTLGSMTQFVSFSIHPTDQNTVVGGTQDNGSPASSAATSNPQWVTVNAGDGGYNTINPNTPTQWFTANTDVSIQVCNNGISCTPTTFTDVVTNTTVGGDSGPFYTPYILDPQNAGEFLVGTCRVWRGSTTGTAFSTLSVNFDTLSNTACNGGEVNQVHALAAGGPKVSNFSSVVYATTEGYGPVIGIGGGQVWATTNAGTTAMSNVTGAINPSNYAISSVAIDGSVANGQTAFVGIMGFGVAHVWKTSNAGGTWTNWTGSGLPDAPVNALLVDSSVSPSQVYAGTDVGVFVSSTTSAVWTEVGPAPGSGPGYLPNVPVSAIRLFNSGGVKKLRVSTYGRGIWEFNLATTPDYTVAVSNSPLTSYPSQTATFNGTLTAVNAYNSPVTLSCGAGAPGACTFPDGNPVTPTDGGLAFRVQLNSGAATTDYNFNIHAVGSDANTTTHDAPVVLKVVNFAVGSPGPVSVQQGGSTNASLQLTATGSFAQGVTLGCTGLPANATCAFAPNPAFPTSATPASVTVTVNAAASTPTGTTTVTVQGTTTNPAATRSATFQLTVTQPPDFTFTGGGTTKTVLAGQKSGAFSFTAAPTNGDTTFANDVTFSCSFSPSDPTLSNSSCVFTPAKISAGTPAAQGTVTMTIATTGPNAGQGNRAQFRARDETRSRLPFSLAVTLAGLVLAGTVGRRFSKHSAIFGLFISIVVLGVLVACGGGGSTGPPPPPPVSVSVSPSAAVNLYANEAGNTWPTPQTQQYTATVSHSSDTAVTWTLRQNGADCTTNPACGTLSATTGSPVTYTAPTTVPNPAAITVRATAHADSSKSGSGTVNVLQPTATGNFMVTVTATEGVKSHTQQVTLTVQ